MKSPPKNYLIPSCIGQVCFAQAAIQSAARRFPQMDNELELHFINALSALYTLRKAMEEKKNGRG